MSLFHAGPRTWWPVLLLLPLFLSHPVLALPGAAENARSPVEGYRTSGGEIPAYAREVFAYVIRNGRAPRGYAGDRLWQNREHRLPAGGDYREYDVHPRVRGMNRGAERIIVDRSAGKGWYTADHYRTFTRIGAK